MTVAAQTLQRGFTDPATQGTNLARAGVHMVANRGNRPETSGRVEPVAPQFNREETAMKGMAHSTRIEQLRRRCPVAIAASLSAALLGGCGGASPTVAAKSTAAAATKSSAVARTSTLGSTAGAVVSGTTQTRSSTTVASLGSGAVGFSRCMRANGVPGFPDPSPGGGFAFKTSSITSSPTFQTAQARCQKLIPGMLPNFRSNPSSATMAKLLRIATCMRTHGVHQFPDPLYNRPRQLDPRKYQEITDFDGATLLFPANMNLQAPAYRQALAACGSPPLGLPH